MNYDIYKKMFLKVDKDYNDLIDVFKKESVDYVIYSAYEISHYNEIHDMICNFSLGNDEFDWLENNEGEFISNYSGNFIEKVFEEYVNIPDYERKNFFYFDYFVDLVRKTIKSLSEEHYDN